jgi:hypothetical protein
MVIPKVLEPLKDQVRTLKSQAERSQTLEASQSKLQQAKVVLEQIRTLEPADEDIASLQEDRDILVEDGPDDAYPQETEPEQNSLAIIEFHLSS